MGVLLLLLGAVLIGLTWKQAWRQALNEEKDAYYLQSVEGLEQRLLILRPKYLSLNYFPRNNRHLSLSFQESLTINWSFDPGCFRFGKPN